MELRTPKQAIFFNNPSLAVIKKECGQMATDSFITEILTDLVMSFNVGKTMNEMQIVEMVKLIQVDYYFLKPSELKYCFNNAKMGKYGQLYDRIDMSVIFYWLERYMEERTNVVITENQNKNKELNTFDSTNVQPKFLEILKNAVKSVDPVKEINMDLIEPKPREKTEQEILVQEIFTEFDELYREKPDSEKEEPFRTIQYQQKNITQDEFLFIRLEELKKL